MIIQFKTSPSKFVFLACHTSHLQAFEVRHCLNPRSKKWYTTPIFKNLSNLVNLQMGHNQYTAELPLAQINSLNLFKLFWALARSSRPAGVVEYSAIPESKVAQGVGGSEA